MSSLDNSLPALDKLDLTPTKWEPRKAEARAPTPPRRFEATPSQPNPRRVPSKNVRAVDLNGIINPKHIGEAPTPRLVMDEAKTFTKPYAGFEGAVQETLVVCNESAHDAELWLSRDDNAQSVKVLHLGPRTRKRVKLQSGRLDEETEGPGDVTVALTTAGAVFDDDDSDYASSSDGEALPAPPPKEDLIARFSTATPMGLELEGTSDHSILVHRVHADSQASIYAWMRPGLRVANYTDLDAFERAYFAARDEDEDVEVLFEDDGASPPTATFLTGTDDAVASRIKPARPVRAPHELGAALRAPPSEIARKCAVCIRNATGRRMVLYAGIAGSSLKRRAVISAHDSSLQRATTAELWLVAFEGSDGDEPALTLRVGSRAVFNVCRSYSLVWRAEEGSLSFVPRSTAVRIPARKERRDYASERATTHLRAMDEVRAAREGAEGHANCVVTVLE